MPLEFSHIVSAQTRSMSVLSVKSIETDNSCPHTLRMTRLTR